MLNDRIIHLTFDKKRHSKAVFYLQERGFKVTANTSETLTRKMLREILLTKVPFARLDSSPFILSGTVFQKKVWEKISLIPFGTTITYGELGQQIGSKQLARAVGQACNANPLALIVPCHRVVGQNGLGGFAGGCSIKEALLELER